MAHSDFRIFLPSLVSKSDICSDVTSSYTFSAHTKTDEEMKSLQEQLLREKGLVQVLL